MPYNSEEAVKTLNKGRRFVKEQIFVHRNFNLSSILEETCKLCDFDLDNYDIMVKHWIEMFLDSWLATEGKELYDYILKKQSEN